MAKSQDFDIFSYALSFINHNWCKYLTSFQMELMKQTGRKWADDADTTNCSSCGGQFTITNRKHHCRYIPSVSN